MHECDRLIVISGEYAEVVYGGPGEPVWNCVSHRAGWGTGKQVRIELDRTVQQHEVAMSGRQTHKRWISHQ
jgi:hypothetical protein